MANVRLTSRGWTGAGSIRSRVEHWVGGDGRCGEEGQGSCARLPLKPVHVEVRLVLDADRDLTRIVHFRTGECGEGSHLGAKSFSLARQAPLASQVRSLTQLYSVNFLQSRISGVEKCAFNKCTIKVCISCSRRRPVVLGPPHLARLT